MITIGLTTLGVVLYVAGVLLGMTMGWDMAHEQSPVLKRNGEEDG